MVVSHDRHLLRATTDQFMIVADGKLQPFDGDLDDYRDWLFKTKLAAAKLGAANTALAATNKTVAPVAVVPPSTTDRREQKRVEAEDRQRLASQRKPIESRIKKLEQKIDQYHAKKAVIDARLADSMIYDNANKEELKTLLADQSACVKELAQLEAEWLEQHDALERMGA